MVPSTPVTVTGLVSEVTGLVHEVLQSLDWQILASWGARLLSTLGLNNKEKFADVELAEVNPTDKGSLGGVVSITIALLAPIEPVSPILGRVMMASAIPSLIVPLAPLVKALVL